MTIQTLACILLTVPAVVLLIEVLYSLNMEKP